MANIALWEEPLGTSPANWQSAFGTEINSLAAGSYALSSVILSNTSGLLTDFWISVALGSVATGTGAPNLAFYLQPLNQDGTTYGDGYASGTIIPVQGYIGAIGWPASQAAAALTGQVKIPSELPPNSFKLGVVNNLGNALAASGNTIAIAFNAFNLNG
jgi:hypothetical protein